VPIKDLQQRFSQVGVIRLGLQKTSAKGKNYPAKLETLRFTSPSRPLIEAVAALYGGEVKAWQPGSGGPQWEVITGVREIPVLVPPQTIDPNYEHWGNGYRDRLCDGETEQIRCQSCLCRAQWGDDFAVNAPVGAACKPTTRMSVMLADIVSLGTFKLESHGWNAAAELPMLAAAIANAPRPIPARLEAQQREKKILHPTKPEKDRIESRVYMVPVLHFDFVTPAQAFSGQIGAAAQKALSGGTADVKEIEGAKLTPSQVMALAKLAPTRAEVERITEQAKAAGVLDEQLHQMLRNRWKSLPATPAVPAAQDATPDPAPAPAEAEPATADAAAPEPAAEVLDADTDEPDAEAVWSQILLAAGKRKLSLAKIETHIQTALNKASDEINGWQMQQILADIEAGRVA